MKSSRLLVLATMPLALAACSTAPTAGDTTPVQTPTPTVATLSVGEGCEKWNEIVQTIWENDTMPDAEFESVLRGQLTELASKTSGSQQADLEILSKEAGRGTLSEEALAADTRLVEVCDTVTYLEAQGFDADGSDVDSAEASSSFEPAPVARTTVIEATIEGGYRANVTVRWHEPQMMAPADFAAFPTCLSFSPTGWSEEESEQTLIRAVVVEGTAEFPVTNGFEWPSGKTLGLKATGPFTCSGTAHGDQVNTSMTTEMEPGTETFSYVLYETSEKTPDNPEGEFDERGEYSLSLTGGHTVDCEEIEGVIKPCSDSF